MKGKTTTTMHQMQLQEYYYYS